MPKRRIYAIILTVLLLSAWCILPASAEYYDWAIGNRTYVGTLTKGTTTYHNQVTNFGDYHTTGTATYLMPYENRTLTEAAVSAVQSTYLPLLTQFNYANTVSYQLKTTQRVNVPASEESGLYYIRVRFPGSSINVTVDVYETQSSGSQVLVTRYTRSSTYTPKTTGIYATYVKG